MLPVTAVTLTAQQNEFRWRATFMNSGIGVVLMCTTLKGGVLQLAALQLFGMSPRDLALLGVAIFATLFIEPLGLVAQYSVGSHRTLAIAYGLRTILLAALALPAWAAAQGSALVVVFCALVVLLNATHIVGFNSCWPPIMRECTTPDTRVAVISWVRSVGSTVVMLFTLAMVVFQHTLTRIPFAEICAILAVFRSFCISAPTSSSTSLPWGPW
jgi:hypothetical protein